MKPARLGHCEPNELDLSVGVGFGKILAACLCIFKTNKPTNQPNPTISKVKAGLFSKINKSSI